MSHWSEVETKINDLETFLVVCEENKIRAQKDSETSYTLNMTDMSGHAKLTQTKTGDWALSYDRDVSYSRFAEKFGTNGGTLVRDYAARVAENQAISMGMTVMSNEIRHDGTIRIVLAA